MSTQRRALTSARSGRRAAPAALRATVGAALAGIVSAVGLVLYRTRETSRRFATVVLVLTLGLRGLMGWTANLGGQVRRTEIRPDGGLAALRRGPATTGSSKTARSTTGTDRAGRRATADVRVPGETVPGSLRGRYEPGFEAQAVEVVFEDEHVEVAAPLLDRLPAEFEDPDGTAWDRVGEFPISVDRVRAIVAPPSTGGRQVGRRPGAAIRAFRPQANPGDSGARS